MSCNSCSNTSMAAFVDLAANTAPLDKMLYGQDQLSYFKAATVKSTPFALFNTCGSVNGVPEFGREFSVTASRVGDYLLHSTIRLQLPELVTKAPDLPLNQRRYIRWTNNIGLALLKYSELCFNDLVAEKITGETLDFYEEFNGDPAKETAWNNMIGNVKALNYNTPMGTKVNSYVLNIPLKHFFTKDSGKALAVAAMPYNEIRFNICFEDVAKLIAVDTVTKGVENGTGDVWTTRPAEASDFANGVLPSIGNGFQLVLNYAVVSNEERKSMACGTRDMLITQHQLTKMDATKSPKQAVDIRYNQSVLWYAFGLKNITEHTKVSNFSTLSPLRHTAPDGERAQVDYDNPYAHHPLYSAGLKYDSVDRFNAPIDQFSLVSGYYHAPRVPTKQGLGLFSFALDIGNINPNGSVNQGKLSNIQFVAEMSKEGLDHMQHTPIVITDGSSDADKQKAAEHHKKGLYGAQRFEIQIMGLVHNVVRISGGALGFPVM